MSNWRKRFRSHLKPLLGITRIDDIPGTVVLWAGPSRLDGKPIMVVASCVRVPSKNGKTEDMIQVAIMSQTLAPFTAWSAGLDGSVCPDSCVHRSKPRGGKGSCYVNKARLRDAWNAAHSYLTEHGKGWSDLFMASVSSVPDMLRAKSLGWRPFFSSFGPKDDAAAVTAGLRLCLAESKAAVGCSRCGGCDGNQKGTKRAGFFLPTHGAIGTSLRKHTTP